PQQVDERGAERDHAEHRVIVEHDHGAKGAAQPRVEPGLAFERHRRELDRAVTQPQRIAERQEADAEEPVGLARGWDEAGFHRRALNLSLRGARSISGLPEIDISSAEVGYSRLRMLANPESSSEFGGWIPGSPLRGAPE